MSKAFPSRAEGTFQVKNNAGAARGAGDVQERLSRSGRVGLAGKGASHPCRVWVRVCLESGLEPSLVRLG